MAVTLSARNTKGLSFRPFVFLVVRGVWTNPPGSTKSRSDFGRTQRSVVRPAGARAVRPESIPPSPPIIFNKINWLKEIVALQLGHSVVYNRYVQKFCTYVRMKS